MKKILSLLLTILLLAQTLSVSVFAIDFNDGILNWGDCTHQYDNVCDTTCNLCTVVRIVPDHVPQGPVCGTRTCIHCGVAVPPVAEHTYDHACDTTCNVCGGVRSTQHVYTNACDTTCDTCGAVRSVPHAYSDACDAYCNLCGAVRAVDPHPYVGAVTTPATCGVEGVMTYTCSVCGHGYTEAIPATEQHTYTNGCDDTCNGCDFVRAVKEHVYDDGDDVTCNECGAVRVPQDDGATPGDVNGDGLVDNKDLVLMLRTLNGWKVQMNLSAADVNGDGAFSIRDAARLQQYLNGWDVEIV